MVLVFLVLVPALLGGAAFAIAQRRARCRLLVAGAAAHAALTTIAWIAPPSPALGLALDPLGLV